MMFLEGSSGGVWMQSRWYGPNKCSVCGCWSSPRPSPLCSRSFLLILVFPTLPSSTAWSIYITDLFILFQDNFHHCSKCIWKERPACHVAADIRKQGKKILHSLQMFFSLLACGAGASFNFNQMPDKGGVVENKWSFICGVSCKQESTSQFPFASCLCFLPALARESFPLSLLWRHCLSSLFPSYSGVAT